MGPKMTRAPLTLPRELLFTKIMTMDFKYQYSKHALLQSVKRMQSRLMEYGLVAPEITSRVPITPPQQKFRSRTAVDSMKASQV